ncbi:MAG: TorF family putative porin [Chromatiales bacterium]|nr:TorF family putative porin [Chromatiales bacterium]
MKSRILAPLSAAIVLASATSAFAEGPHSFSANVALGTDYVWRGISQTDENPAISGGFDYGHESGFYAGIWGSNVDFGDDATIEVDLYGGFAKELESGFSFDVGFIHYNYPDESDLNFEEVYVGVGFGPASAKISHDFDNDNTYYEAGADFEVAGFGLGAHVGYYDFDGGDEYTDWKLAVSKEYGGFGFELAYTDTDIDDVDTADSRIVFTISKSM